MCFGQGADYKKIRVVRKESDAAVVAECSVCLINQYKPVGLALQNPLYVRRRNSKCCRCIRIGYRDAARGSAECIYRNGKVFIQRDFFNRDAIELSLIHIS